MAHRFSAKRVALILTILVAAGISVAAAQYLRRDAAGLQVTTGPLTRGEIVETVSATGALEAVTTVEVGTQVSGTVKELAADFNQIVKKGQVIARLEPSLLEAQVEQARASLAKSEADLQRLQVNREDARMKLDRARRLADQQLIAATDLEAADVALRSAEAELASARASASQARANLNHSLVNLGHTVIRSPIDGIVISRNVDVGQTVAASMSAPTLYVLAADLTRMQVNASVDEADVGRVHAGQPVRFTVDAYPERQFEGVVRQVRLQPKTEQNVVTYTTVVTAANPELLLKPGMTANITIELARSGDVLTAPAAALRFRPTEEMFAALDQPVPEAGAGGSRVWTYREGRLEAIGVRTGVSNGARVEIRPTAEGPLSEGVVVVTGATTGATAAAARNSSGASTTNPFVPTPPRPPGSTSQRVNTR
jgi:HlyD family secretion protein